MSDQPAIETESPKGLDAILSSAIDEHYVEPGEVPLVSEPDKPAVAAEAAADSRPRDDRGRFSSSAAEKPSTGSADPAASLTESPAPQAPRNYSAEQKAQFAKLPREAQEFLTTAEAAREAEYTRRSQEAAEYRRTADPYVQAISPYRDYLQQIAPSIGQTPEQMVNAILAAEYTLRNGTPAQKYQAFAQLAQTYGVNPAALASGQVPAQTQPHQSVVDPALQQRLDAIERWAQTQHEQREIELSEKSISDFANAKDEQGRAKYPHFERVRVAMASFLQAGHAEGLEDAYRLATDPFKSLIDQELAAKKSELEKQAAVEKAKKAAPVKTSTGISPRGGVESKGLDAHISAALDRFYGH